MPPPESLRQSLAAQTVTRSLQERYSSAEDEVARLVEATFSVIATDGTTDPSVRAILRESGLSTQAFYRHFRSKDELMCVVLDEGVRILISYLRHRMEKAAGPLEAVRIWIEGWAAQTKDTRTRGRTTPWSINQGRLLQQFPEQLAQSTADITGLLAYAIETGNERGLCDSPDPGGDAERIHDYVMAQVRRSLAREKSIDAASVRAMVDFAYRAIRAEV